MPPGEEGPLRFQIPGEGVAGCVKITHIQQIPFFFFARKVKTEEKQEKSVENLYYSTVSTADYFFIIKAPKDRKWKQDMKQRQKIQFFFRPWLHKEVQEYEQDFQSGMEQIPELLYGGF
jgi:hypothetical protein